MYNNPTHKYQKMQHNVTKTKQIVLLYEGISRFVEAAAQAIDRGDLTERYNQIMKAIAIIDGLQNCLDFDNGQNVAQILYNYYTSIYTRLMSVHQSNSKETLEEVLKDINVMKAAWEDIDKQSAEEANNNTPKEGDDNSGSTEISA